MVIIDIIVCRIAHVPPMGSGYENPSQYGDNGMSESGGVHCAPCRNPESSSTLPRGHHIALPYDHVLLQLETASPAHA
jgi:hypothetical protein